MMINSVMPVIQKFVAPALCLSTLFLVAAPLRAGDPVASKQPVLEEAVNWKTNTISPVADPILFEDAMIRTEVKPVFGYQNVAEDFFSQGGELLVYGIQIRYAVTDRFALIGTKGGYMEFHPKVGPDLEGWGDLGAGFKYALIDDVENQFILTPGVVFEAPTGDKEVYQGTGDGVFNLFVSAEKGFGDFHIITNVGLLLPVDGDAKSTILHYHIHADYYVCKLFIPFVVANGYSVVSPGTAVPLDTEGYDLTNFGSSASDGVTQATVGAGFRSRLTSNIDFGFSYEKAVVKPEGLVDDRYTVDFVIRF